MAQTQHRQMAQTQNRRSAVAGAVLGAAGTIALVLGLGVLASTGTAAAPTAKPENSTPPTVSGTPREGATLTGTRGEWTNNPTDYNYRWQRCDANGGSCSGISGATRATYALKKVDVGNTLRFRVEAVNRDGSTFASSVPTAVISAAPVAPPPAATGCPAGSGTIQINDLALPARLMLEAQQANPSLVTRGTDVLTLRYKVTACGGRPVQGALVYAAAVPFNQFSIEERATGSDGWAQLDLRQLRGFPASQVQQLVAVMARARKPGENLLGGVSTRRLFSVRASV
jgi:hypothetical protein